MTTVPTGAARLAIGPPRATDERRPSVPARVADAASPVAVRCRIAATGGTISATDTTYGRQPWSGEGCHGSAIMLLLCINHSMSRFGLAGISFIGDAHAPTTLRDKRERRPPCAARFLAPGGAPSRPPHRGPRPDLRSDRPPFVAARSGARKRSADCRLRFPADRGFHWLGASSTGPAISSFRIRSEQGPPCADCGVPRTVSQRVPRWPFGSPSLADCSGVRKERGLLR